MQYYRNACKPVSDWSYYAITLFPFKWVTFCLLLSRHHRSNDRLDLLDGKHKRNGHLNMNILGAFIDILSIIDYAWLRIKFDTENQQNN